MRTICGTVLVAVLAVAASGAIGARGFGEKGGDIADDLAYLRGKWRGDVTDKTTGIGIAELKKEAERIVAAEKDRLPWCIVKAHLFEMICDRMSVGFSPRDFFPAFACYSRKDRVLTKVINDRMSEIDRRYCPEASRRAGAVKGSCLRHDYDHAAPDSSESCDIAFLTGRPLSSAVAEAMAKTFAAMKRIKPDIQVVLNESRKPRVIVLLGSDALKKQMPTARPVRGKWIALNGVPAVMTFSPDYIFSHFQAGSPHERQAKSEMWEDIKSALARLPA